MSDDPGLFDIGKTVDFRDQAWSRRLADKLLEVIHRQNNPMIQRRIVAAYFQKVAGDAVKETVDQMVREGK